MSARIITRQAVVTRYLILELVRAAETIADVTMAAVCRGPGPDGRLLEPGNREISDVVDNLLGVVLALQDEQIAATRQNCSVMTTKQFELLGNVAEYRATGKQPPIPELQSYEVEECEVPVTFPTSPGQTPL